MERWYFISICVLISLTDRTTLLHSAWTQIFKTDKCEIIDTIWTVSKWIHTFNDQCLDVTENIIAEVKLKYLPQSSAFQFLLFIWSRWWDWFAAHPEDAVCLCYPNQWSPIHSLFHKTPQSQHHSALHRGHCMCMQPPTGGCFSLDQLRHL